MNKLGFWLCLLAVGCGAGLQAQELAGVGIRVNPDGAGAEVKVFLDPHVSLQGMINGSAGFNMLDDGPSFTIVGLAEYNIILPDPSWRIFLGGGVHAGSWDRYNHRYNDRVEATQGIFGVDGIFGIEYMFRNAPLGISADVKPAVNLTSETAFFPNNQFGLAVTYYFGHKVKLGMPPPPPLPPRPR